MAQFVNKCILEFNGVTFEDFESFTETSVTLGKQVNCMNKTGFADMTPRYGFSVNVFKSHMPAVIDLYKIKDGTLTVEDDNNDRITFSGVRTLETGDGTRDGETELTNTIVYGATKRVPPLN